MGDNEVRAKTYSLEDITKLMNNIEQTNNNVEKPKPKEQPTYNIFQVISVILGAITLVGGVIVAWINMNNQITTLKVSTELTFSQIAKDQAIANASNLEFRNKTLDEMKALGNKLESLDNTLTQLYLSNNNSQKKK
jgi:hypothetical protein